MASSSGDEGTSPECSLLGCFRTKSFRQSMFMLLVVSVLFDAVDDFKSWKEFIPVFSEQNQNSIQSSWTGLRQVTVNEPTLAKPRHSKLTVIEEPPSNTGPNTTIYDRYREKGKKIANDKKIRKQPRAIFLDSEFDAKKSRTIEDMWLGANDPNVKSYGMTPKLTNPVTLDGNVGDDDCKPVEYQTRFYPNCNAFHELDFNFQDNDRERVQQRKENDHYMTLLGIGTSRNTWTVKKDSDKVVLKTLQQDRPFYAKVYQHQIVDAVASERLSGSPYVLDIYGFCGPSVLNELGKPLELRNNTIEESLRFSRDLAAGLADTHGIDGATTPNLVHADLRHNNVMFSYETGVLKLSDYNQGYFLGKNEKKNEQCGYKPSFSFWHDRFAAPEECYGGVQTEKTDIYHLGGMIFYFLTQYKPYTFNKGDFEDREKTMSTGKKKWAFPELPPRFVQSSDPAVKTMLKAIDGCLRRKPEARASARDIHRMLDKALRQYTASINK